MGHVKCDVEGSDPRARARFGDRCMWIIVLWLELGSGSDVMAWTTLRWRFTVRNGGCRFCQ